MRGARRDALLSLDEANHIETKTAREIGPRVVIRDERCARIWCEHLAPVLLSRSELRQKPLAIGNDAVAMFGRAAHERLRNARRDDDCVFWIEPVMRVAYAVRVAALVHDALSAYLEQRNPRRGVHVGIAAAHDARVADSSDERIEPVIVA